MKKYVDNTSTYVYNSLCCGSLVKRLRRRPLTAETGVRFPYELFCFFIKQPNPKDTGCPKGYPVFLCAPGGRASDRGRDRPPPV